MAYDSKNLISISSKVDLSEEEFGYRARTISILKKLGFPVSDGYCMSSELIRQIIEGGPTPKFSRRFLEGSLFCLRSSPIYRKWRGPESILYLGLNREKLESINDIIGESLGKYLYLEHIRNFGVKVLKVEPDLFDQTLHHAIKIENVKSVRELSNNLIDDLTSQFEEYYRIQLGFDFPEDEAKQIHYAIKFIADEWENPTSKVLRMSLGAEPNASMGAILQKMVLAGEKSRFGLLEIQSINSSTGEENINGRYISKELWNLQSTKNFTYDFSSSTSIEDFNLDDCNSVLAISVLNEIDLLEKKVFKSFGKRLNFSFLIKDNEIILIDAKDVELEASALMRLNVEGVIKGLITKEKAILSTDPEMLLDSLHPQICKDAEIKVIGLGLPASPGAVSGCIAFRAEEAIQMNSKGITTLLVRSETSSEDIRGMHASAGVLTLRGGMSSHAAVVARGLGKPCVVGVSDLSMDNSLKSLVTSEGLIFKTGDLITIDGSNGRVLMGDAQMVQPKFSKHFYQIMEWANELGKIGVKANADTPQEAIQAKEFDVDGIGLCRTEHMFFEKNTLQIMQKMILASNEVDQNIAIEALLPIQQGKFEEIFKIMEGLSVTIRLLDLPIHEFLPNSLDELKILANDLGLTFSQMSERSKQMSEINPMLGKRGVRMGILLPNLYKMQVSAILNASIQVYGSNQVNFAPEIMLPMVSSSKEVDIIRDMIDKEVDIVTQKVGSPVSYKLGVMIETPRAVLKAGELASSSSFLSFGTNDLTQMTYGLSRDDSGTFMRDYIAQKIFPEDPFRSLDIEGVGELLKIASERSRASNPNIKLGICGEHGGDPKSIEFCKKIGLDFVSCSPYRVPMARLGAAHTKSC